MHNFVTTLSRLGNVSLYNKEDHTNSNSLFNVIVNW